MLTDKKISSNCEDINFCFMLFLDIYEFILCATMFNFIVSINIESAADLSDAVQLFDCITLLWALLLLRFW